jgi:uncharacterized SAM-binding protein YcdF (DUF218 family)
MTDSAPQPPPPPPAIPKKRKRFFSLRPLSRLTNLLGLLLLAWAIGLLAFIHTVEQFSGPETPESVQETDAIVVLTGGSERLQTGLDLLAAGRGQKLFVSGVYRGVDTAALLRFVRGKSPVEADRIVLGHSAGNTIENAEETAAWMRGQGYKSFHLVTSNYHMPRSLLEFRMAFADADIHPFPVQPDTVHLNDWWHWPQSADLLIREYGKYLAALTRYALHSLFREIV